MANSFCRYLGNQMRIQYDQLRPCCWFADDVAVDSQKDVATYQQRLHHIVDFKTAQGACAECEQRESKGLFSPRLESFEKSMFKADDPDGVIKNLEIQLDRDCNAACLICGPWNSTTWQKYEAKLKGWPISAVPSSSSATARSISKIIAHVDFSQIEKILILGGEPLRTDSHVRFLEQIKNPATTTVQYTTNGSYRPDPDTLEIWSRFKQIRLCFSVDGVGDHFNYLRWPLQWNQVQDNLTFLLELASNIKIIPFSYTTTPFSLYYQDRYVSWAQDFFKSRSDIRADHMFAKPWQPRGATPMSLGAVPPKLASAIRDKYGDDHAIARLLESYDPVKHQEFMTYIQLHDQHRGTDWRITFPEMIPYFS